MTVGIAGSFRLEGGILSFSNDEFSILIKWRLSDARIQILTTSQPIMAMQVRAVILRRSIKATRIVGRNHN